MCAEYESAISSCVAPVGYAASGGTVNVGVRRVTEMEATGGRGEASTADEGPGTDEEVGREEVGSVWRLTVAEDWALGATLNTAISCSMPGFFLSVKCLTEMLQDRNYCSATTGRGNSEVVCFVHVRQHMHGTEEKCTPARQRCLGPLCPGHGVLVYRRETHQWNRGVFLASSGKAHFPHRNSLCLQENKLSLCWYCVNTTKE